MKVLKLEIENYKKLKALYKEINGENFEVSGKPGVGKTTAISALWDILHSVGEPLKKGEKKGHIKIILGDKGQGKTIIAKREFTPKTNTPIVLTSEGDKITMKEFQDFYCGLGINPQEILEQSPKDFLKTILKATKQPEGYDIEKLESDIKREEDERTLLYREYEKLKKSLPKEPEKVEKVDTAALNEEILAAKDKENELEQKKHELNQIAEKGQNHKKELESNEKKREQQEEEIKQLEQRIKELREGLKETDKEKANLQKQKEQAGVEYRKKQEEINNFEIPDIQEIRDKMTEAERTNEKAREYEKWEEQQKKHKEAETAYKNKMEEIKKLKQKQKDVMNKSEFPLEGLAISDGKIYYDDILVENLGTSKKKLVSAAIAAQIIKDEGKIKVVRMDGVESMDVEDYNKMKEIFNNNGIQVLSSRVIRKEQEREDNEILIEEA